MRMWTIFLMQSNARHFIALPARSPLADSLRFGPLKGQRGKIHQIHMRNIRGGLHNFYEVFPDEGEMDFLKIMRILRDTQFSSSICPDHMPSYPDDPGGFQAFRVRLRIYQGPDSTGQQRSVM